ncbi:hypothetical protein B0O80DRAFT_491845 [Mortierella sp. GBAus27b]|nr:hypothetical protein B0O80DRAFT_491845 [Mortierella sp. GBAus27b]
MPQKLQDANPCHTTLSNRNTAALSRDTTGKTYTTTRPKIELQVLTVIANNWKEQRIQEASRNDPSNWLEASEVVIHPTKLTNVAVGATSFHFFTMVHSTLHRNPLMGLKEATTREDQHARDHVNQEYEHSIVFPRECGQYLDPLLPERHLLLALDGVSEGLPSFLGASQSPTKQRTLSGRGVTSGDSRNDFDYYDVIRAQLGIAQFTLSSEHTPHPSPCSTLGSSHPLSNNSGHRCL